MNPNNELLQAAKELDKAMVKHSKLLLPADLTAIAEVERLRAEPEPRASSGLVKAVRDYVDAEDEDRASEFNAMYTALRAAESIGGN